MLIFNFFKQNLIQIYTEIYQITQLKNCSWGGGGHVTKPSSQSKSLRYADLKN